jgi:nitrite reductase/ring-hydroxylating ferredoxin subunit
MPHDHDCALEAGPCRRTVLASGALGAVGAMGAVALAGCGAGNAATQAGSGASGAVSQAIAKASIPVGGGKVFPDQQVVVTQPTAGSFKAFSAVCTHAGCVVAEVSQGAIHCPCHGSAFDAATGAVRQGPATQPLPEKTVTVSGDTLKVT